MNNAPIGVFDSGLGGLTVWSELYKRLPHESLVYYGDGKNCPYGDKSQAEVVTCVDFAVKRLMGEGVKMIVVACNAATALAIRYLRESYDIPFVGLEPAVKPAVESTQTGVVGVLATSATLHGPLFRTTAAKYADRARILPAVGRGFVELVEQNRENAPEADEIVRPVLEPLLDAGADRIVLGCTHYPFLAGTMRNIIGNRDVRLVNPAAAIEKRVESLLESLDMGADPQGAVRYDFMTSADETYRQHLIRKSEMARTMNFE